MTGRKGLTLRVQGLGQQIKELRETAGITLRQAADYLERAPSTVSRFQICSSVRTSRTSRSGFCP